MENDDGNFVTIVMVAMLMMGPMAATSSLTTGAGSNNWVMLIKATYSSV